MPVTRVRQREENQQACVWRVPTHVTKVTSCSSSTPRGESIQSHSQFVVFLFIDTLCSVVILGVQTLDQGWVLRGSGSLDSGVYVNKCLLFCGLCRNFRCDCGNRKFTELQCKLHPVSLVHMFTWCTV